MTELLHANPPRWVEAVVRALLDPRDRDTISGDLLEEYREVARPTLGVLRADLWYVRHASSFLTAERCWRAALRSIRRPLMRKSESVWWAAAGLAALSFILVLLVRSRFTPPRLPMPWAALLPAAFGLFAATALRTVDVRFWRAGVWWGLLFGAAMAARMVVDIVVPFDIEAFFLAQARDGFSFLLAFPRWTLLGVAIALVFLAAGFVEAKRTGRLRVGTLAAMTASITGFVVTFAAAALRSVISYNRPGVGIDVPVWGVIPLLLISIVLGTIGALFGKSLAAHRQV